MRVCADAGVGVLCGLMVGQGRIGIEVVAQDENRVPVLFALCPPHCPFVPSAPRSAQLPSLLAHPAEDNCTVAIHSLRPSLQRSWQDGSKPCRFFPADIPGRDLVVITTCLRSINTGAPFDHVEVYLQNAFFPEDQFGHRYEACLCALAEGRAARSEEQVFYDLLRNGRSSASAIAFQILFSSDLDLVPIESMVLIEARVLRGDYSVLEIW